jgi:hypothetical protein
MKYYLLDNFNLFGNDWEDVLRNGYIPWDEDSNPTVYYVERVGPFVPDGYIASSQLIFTGKVKSMILKEKFTGISFSSPLENRKLVRVDWRDFTNHDDFINLYTNLELNEPEDILEMGEHDPDLLKVMPTLWKANIDTEVSMKSEDISYKETKIARTLNFYLHDPITTYPDFFQGSENYSGYFVSEKVKKWLADNCPECFEMREAIFHTSASNSV